MAEKEYIEREAAFNAILKLVPKVDDDGYCWVIRGDAATAIDNIPAADVREVVYCKDCKWYEINELKKDGTEDRRYKPSVCMLAGQRREPNHFCADGEKREERWTQIVCKKCGGKRFITRGDVVVCDRCGADMREEG